MKILYLTQILPYPFDSGGKIKTYQTLRILGQKHQVFLTCFLDSRKNIGHTQKLKKICYQVKCFYRPVITSRFREIAGIVLKSMVSLLPFEVYRYSDRRMSSYLKEIIDKESFDAIHIDHLNMAQYLPKEKTNLWVLEEHNVESKLAQKAFKKEKRLSFKFFYFWESIKFWFFEKKYLRKFDRILAISQKDRIELIKKGIAKDKITVLPVSLKTKNLFSFSDKEKIILFVGFLSWWPNKNAFFWFYKKVFPLIKKRIPRVEFWLIGRQPAKAMIEFSRRDYSLQLLGHVENIEDYLKKTSVFIVPIQSGSGIRMKILTSLAAGIPVVSTTVGAEGIAVKPNQGILIANTPEEFVSAVIRVLKSKRLALRLSKKGRDFIKKYYNQKEAGRVLDEVYF